MADSVRADVWVWSVRLFRTRALASAACKAGHVKINGTRAKAAQPICVGDRVEALTDGGRRVVEVTQLVRKRVGAAVAAGCFIDHSPPPPPRAEVAAVPRRDRGAGRPTKRERRALDRLRGS